jgi:glycosyltransferase involved in cell wall biosynthesis
MRAWIVNQFLVPPSRAGGTRHWSLARRLARCGYDVSLVGWENEADRTSMPSVTESAGRGSVEFQMVRLRTRHRHGQIWRRAVNMLRFAWALRGHIRGRNVSPDVIVGSTPTHFTAFIALREARRRGVPFVLEVRDIWPQTLIDLGGYSPWHPGVLLLGALERYLYRSADHIVSLLPLAVEHIVNKGGDATKVTWIPNGVDFEMLPESLSSELEYDAGSTEPAPFRVLYTGAHGLANALDAVVDTASLLHERAPGSFEFTFIGKGHRKHLLQERVSREGITNVSFHPPVSKQEVYEHLAGADALIVNMNEGSLYRFGISFNKLFDYLAVGRPIIFGSAAVNDPVRASGGGISVAANDAGAMAEALEQLRDIPPAERAEMGARGLAYVKEHHDMDLLGRRLAQVLDGVVNPDPRVGQQPKSFSPTMSSSP